MLENNVSARKNGQSREM